MISSKDLKIETCVKRRRMKVDTATNCDTSVRITHIPTGVIVESWEKSSQLKNKDECIKLLKEKLKLIEQDNF